MFVFLCLPTGSRIGHELTMDLDHGAAKSRHILEAMCEDVITPMGDAPVAREGKPSSQVTIPSLTGLEQPTSPPQGGAQCSRSQVSSFLPKSWLNGGSLQALAAASGGL